MYRRILVPLDGSEQAEAILPVVSAIARQGGSSVTLLRVASPGAASADGDASAYLQQVASNLQAGGLSAACEVRSGSIAEVILAFADDARSDLIAMSTHGRGGLSRLLMGSVSDTVVRNGHLPVLLVRSSDNVRPPFKLRRILAPVDGSPVAESALIHAQRLAKAFDAEVLLLSVWDGMGYRLGSFPETELEMKKQEEHANAKFTIIETTHRLQAEGVRVHWKLQAGPVTQCILETARATDSDLIVMATHALTGISRLLEGSVADEVLRASPAPVLMIRTITP